MIEIWCLLNYKRPPHKWAMNTQTGRQPLGTCSQPRRKISKEHNKGESPCSKAYNLAHKALLYMFLIHEWSKMEHACDRACRPCWHSLRETLGLAEGHESHEVIHETAGVEDSSAAQQEADAC